ncbi:hypothetical protein [Pseudomonas tohonis]|uniref:Uncharacterized protein n=1 Tax=Pseudomonas tohonis TaxID=2725477 RepID=A0ABQ4VWW8_9PSED|nr:hypothetical protein [Pseudomonas tohonis]GJN50833.1 hypothetical protein TUM20286_05850 [Pseudomonas tohonis]
MLGYMTAQEAKSLGFTHHGKYYGIPVWVGDPHGDCMVATKWAPLELLMSLWHHVEGLCHAMRGTEPTFMFLVGREIE